MAEPSSSSEPAGQMAPSSAHGWSDERVEQVVGNLLRAGVILAAGVVGLGGMLYLMSEKSQPVPDRSVFHGEPPQNRRPFGILKSAWSLSSEGLIMLGLLLLILTPIARVVFSVLAFALQRDRTYVFTTLVVLAILLYSLFSGHIH